MTVDVVIAGNVVCDAIIGSAAQVNIMPDHTMKALNLKPTGPSSHSLLFPGGDGESIPIGVIKDIPVDVGRVRILTTFHVLSTRGPKHSYSLILGLPWMREARAVMKSDKDGRFLVQIGGGDETVTIPKRKTASDDQPKLISSLVEIGRIIKP